MEETHKPILILYYDPDCPFSQRVLHFLEEIGESIPLKNVNEDPKAKEELLHLGGKSQTPCLFIDDKPLYESQDIIEWLSKKKTLLS